MQEIFRYNIRVKQKQKAIKSSPDYAKNKINAMKYIFQKTFLINGKAQRKKHKEHKYGYGRQWMEINITGIAEGKTNKTKK